MEKPDGRFSHLFALLCLISLPLSASALSKRLLGVAPQDVKYYQLNVIKCKDGSKEFDREKLNDEFCDCPDGTDEPGTSACPDGKFYCQNAGHLPLILFSSRVNDGICDCCDGSDEYGDKVKCPNTCWEAGKMARDKLKEKIATYLEGVTIRKQEVENAKWAIAKDEAELSKLKDDEKILKGLVEQLRERKEQIEEAEEQERIEKEKEEERLGKAENNAKEQEQLPSETHHNESNGATHMPPETFEQHAAKDEDDAAVVDEAVLEAGTGSDTASNHRDKQEQDNHMEGLTREDLGRIVASRWTGEVVGKKTNELDDSKEAEHEGNLEITDVAQDDDIDGGSGGNGDDDDDDYFSEAGENSEEDSDEEMEDSNVDDELDEEEDYDPLASHDTDMEDKAEFSGSLSWLDKIQQSVQNILQADLRTPVDKSEAAVIRNEYDVVSKKLFKLQARISSLTEKLKYDYGMEKEFFSFQGRCFKYKQNKYIYKVCPYKQASQVEGHRSTQLGYWDKFDNSYRIMQFTNGDGCWNGPTRSLKVRLRCGLNEELTDIDEQSRCEYVAVLSTPVLCLEEKLQELQQKLDLINMNKPLSHDEL